MAIRTSQASGSVLVRHHCPTRIHQTAGTVLVSMFDGNFVGTPTYVHAAMGSLLVKAGGTNSRIHRTHGTVLVSHAERDIRPATDAHFCRNQY